MQFWDYTTHFTWGQKNGFRCKTMEEFNDNYIAMWEAASLDMKGVPLEVVDPFTVKLLEAETAWAKARRPYYNVWPGIIPALLKLKLDIDSSYFKLPLDQLLIRFPVKAEHPLTFMDGGKEWRVRNIMATNSVLRYTSKPGDIHYIPGYKGATMTALAYHIDIGEEIPGSRGLLSRTYKHIGIHAGQTVEWSFTNCMDHSSASVGVQMPKQLMLDIARLICTICLLASDPDMVEPDVLADDAERYAKTRDNELVTKAHRRGKVGWNVGKDIEVVPHYRRACPAALYWTGEGRRFPRIRFRKGSMVHRKRLASVPTGFMGPLEKEKADVV